MAPSPVQALALALSALVGSICPAQCPGRYNLIPGGNFNGTVFSLLPQANGDLIVAGGFYTLTTPPLRRMAVWNGSDWSEFAGGANGGVALLQLPGGDIIAGGLFTQIGGLTTSYIARWAGSSWSALGNGLPHSAAILILLPNGDLLAGGSLPPWEDHYPDMISRWDGQAWTPFPTTDMDGFGKLAPLANGELVASSAGVADGRLFLARHWDGQAWRPLMDDTTSFYFSQGCCTFIEALLPMPNGDLIAGGSFFLRTDAGLCPNVARWDRARWLPMGEGLNGNGNTSTVWDLALMPNGEVIAAGDFGLPDPIGRYGLARWDGSQWSPLAGAITGGLAEPSFTLAVTRGGALVSATSEFDPTGAVITRWEQPGADFDGDADVGTDADIAAFFACLAGDCCPMCVGPDFNGDGSPGTDADIEAFFRVLAGGPC